MQCSAHTSNPLHKPIRRYLTDTRTETSLEHDARKSDYTLAEKTRQLYLHTHTHSHARTFTTAPEATHLRIPADVKRNNEKNKFKTKCFLQKGLMAVRCAFTIHIQEYTHTHTHTHTQNNMQCTQTE